jgi:hypothetical protein
MYSNVEAPPAAIDLPSSDILPSMDHTNVENAEKNAVITPTARTFPCGNSGRKSGNVIRIEIKNMMMEKYRDFKSDFQYSNAI